MLEHEDVAQILKLLDATALAEFELETERFRIVLRRAAGGGWTQEHETRGVASGEQTAAPTYASEPCPAIAPAPADAPGVRAPLVGTFYRSPKPGAPPFVEVGTLVGVDTVIAIIETMKLMTCVYAERAGQISEILVADGHFVEQNQLLMIIVPAAA